MYVGIWMSGVVRVDSIKFIVFCHATESLDKVKRAVLNLLPEGLRGKVRFKIYAVRGHYGNPISVVMVEVNKARYAMEILSYLISRMRVEDREYLVKTMRDRVDDEGNVHFRLDKQEAYMGNVRVCEGSDVVKVKVHISPEALISLLKGCRDIG